MKGKRLPQIGRIEIAIVEETNPRLLMFNAGQTDMLDVPGDVAPKMIDSKGNLLPEYAARTRSALPNTGPLAPESFGALVSLVYNRGASFAAAGDRYAEMRAIHDCMAMAVFGRIYDQAD